MKIDIQWYSDSKRIIHISYHAGWTWEDFHAMRQQAKQLLRSVEHDVATIQEYDRDAGILPSHAFRNLSITFGEAEPNSTLAVLVSPSLFWRVVLNALKNILPNSVLQRTYFVKNRDEALRILEPYLNSEAA